jgi:prepilin signal peptidase PulO-like enzyme (type II secretory pathway)
VNALLALPPALRVAGVFALGLLAGSAINWAIYALAWQPRPISPWSPAGPQAPPRRWFDRLPVVGWLGVSREESLHGRWFWLRPLLIEIAFAAGIAALYWFEINFGLIPPRAGLAPPSQAMLHWQFAAHAVLLALMTAATFIDFDEQTIPDRITVPGTLLGLALAASIPISHLPVLVRPTKGVAEIGVGTLHVASPHDFPEWLFTWRGLTLGCLIFAGWCAALAPATCTLRRGWAKSVQYYLASLVRDRLAPWFAVLAIVGCGAIAAIWWQGGGHWQALFTSLVGLAFGGGLIWAVRIVGWVALRREAMGFGDVTLMAMIGAFLGWQPALLVFFFSPATAVIVAVTQWIITRRHEIAFGPYLCLSALYVIVAWASIWNGYAEEIFSMGWLMAAIVAACLLLMMGLLMLMRIAREAVFGKDGERGREGDGERER